MSSWNSKPSAPATAAPCHPPAPSTGHVPEKRNPSYIWKTDKSHHSERELRNLRLSVFGPLHGRPVCFFAGSRIPTGARKGDVLRSANGVHTGAANRHANGHYGEEEKPGLALKDHDRAHGPGQSLVLRLPGLSIGPWVSRVGVRGRPFLAIHRRSCSHAKR